MSTPEPDTSVNSADLVAALRAASKEGDVQRLGMLSVAAPRMTVEELRVVKTALDNPPEKGDLFATLASIGAAVAAIAKSLQAVFERTPVRVTTFEGLVLLASSGVVALLIHRYIVAANKKHPFHEQAKKYITDMIGKD